MVHECQFVYETGRKCRRIPKRGDALCPGHRPNPARSHHDDPDFARRLSGYMHQLRGLGFADLLNVLQDNLTEIQPVLDRNFSDRKSSRAAYTPFARAFIAVSIAIERMHDLRSAAVPRSAVHASPVSRPAMPNPAVSYDQHPSPRECR